MDDSKAQRLADKWLAEGGVEVLRYAVAKAESQGRVVLEKRRVVVKAPREPVTL